ncbi:YrhC family protein [Anoxybacillus suryakundensis]|uniref:YrhC-like protein n=1 Tax=Anoxybacillus suryakundensis TaxID=1325335 RepID=A0A0K6GQS7_9BACL|nr:YrhC family protein [Anoxybacillus suryakundensis]CUA81084.1 YrhC-like protein [Anoxybacillus suryakundensis]
MLDEQKRHWLGKARDYKAYSLVLFALSAFLYIGTWIPNAIDEAKRPLVLGAVFILMLASIFFSHRSHIYARKIEEEA